MVNIWVKISVAHYETEKINYKLITKIRKKRKYFYNFISLFSNSACWETEDMKRILNFINIFFKLISIILSHSIYE